MTNNIAGLDLHKSRSYITVMDGNGQILGEENLASKAEPILNYLKDFTPKPEVVFEATRNWYWLYDALQREGFRVTMAHPNKTKVIAEAKIKTDRVDSKMLAHLKRTDLLPESYLAPLEIRETREVLRHRVFLVRQRSKIKSKIRTLLAKLNLNCPKTDVLGKEAIDWLKKKSKIMPSVFKDKLENFLRLGEELKEKITSIEQVINREAAEDGIVQLLITIPGVAEFTALLVRAEIGNIKRFPDADHLASYCGLVPSVRSSGNHTKRGHITKEGNRWLRWALVEASLNVRNGSEHFKNFYYRILARKDKNIAKVATARKLAVAIYHMWTRREPFKEPGAQG